MVLIAFNMLLNDLSICEATECTSMDKVCQRFLKLGIYFHYSPSHKSHLNDIKHEDFNWRTLLWTYNSFLMQNWP